VITSNRSSLPEVAEDAAYYINPNKPSTIAEALVRLTRKPELKERLCKKGLQQAQKYTWPRAAENFLKILES
jgi:glycosyltransferase involved in cell wall biosynthesis